MELRVVTYNCCSIRKRIDPIKEILCKVDILLCQEIILLEEDCDILYTFDENFNVIVKPSTRPTGLGDGRPVGGIAIFYRKSMQMRIRTLYETDNFIVLNIDVMKNVFNIVNVYMPCEDRSIDSHVKYQSILGEFQGVLDDSDCEVLFAGDFNASHLSPKRFWFDLKNFIESNDLSFNDSELPIDTFTYLNCAHNCTSWIDHIIASKNLTITKIKVLYESALYDHFPMSFTLKFKHKYPKFIPDSHINSPELNERINWKALKNNAVRSKYNRDIMMYMARFEVCNVLKCEIDHSLQINHFYAHLVYAFKFATRDLKFKQKSKFKPIPGWNDHCREKYQSARNALFSWIPNGKNTYGPYYDEMTQTRKIFRNALKLCKYQEQQIRDDKLAENILKGDPSKFWKEVRSRIGKFQKSRPENIDNIKDPKEISDMFADRFSAITGNKTHLTASDACLNHSPDFIELIRIEDVKTAVSRLKNGVGADGVFSTHFKYANEQVLNLVIKFYNSCLIHGHVPASMLEGVITPRLKNKFGDKSDPANYREVMISTNFMKCFEYIILPSLETHCKLSYAQYGYRSNTSTTLAVATLREVIHKYTRGCNAVYSCFLDLSKAFERVNHDFINRKLHESTLPTYVINIIKIMLGNSTSCVNYHGNISKSWSVSRGVRQGGILSAHLFSFYVDSIIREISQEPYGCLLGINKINIQAYADDMVLICPTAKGLRELLLKFSSLMSEHELQINVAKTKVIVFHKGRNPYRALNFEINGLKIEQVPSYKYLGSFISFNLRNQEDIKRLQSSFNKKVGMYLRKFHAVSLDIKIRLFDSLCMDLYGMDLWYDNSSCKTLLKNVAVSYHYALKRILGFPKRSSNHAICYLLDRLTFDHLINYRILKFYRWVYNCNSPCILINKIYFTSRSMLKCTIENTFSSLYDVDDVIDNDIDALRSRILYVQNREESSWNSDV